MRPMSPLLAGITDAYREGIVDTGREPQFLFLVSFLCSFGFIRTSAHLIRAQVSWWPGNVEVGGTHIHHLVWGILLLLVSGWVAVALEPQSPWREMIAVMFGVGTGLTLDEFALWLNLRDVYWSQEGRRSIDAVIVAAAVAGMALVGFRGWLDAATTVEDEIFAVVGGAGALGIAIAVINAAKEKFGVALVGLVVMPVGVVGALRLAKPRSVWARFYGDAKRKRAERRFAGSRGDPFWRRMGRLPSRLGLRRTVAPGK
jgi:lysyl-tRNA synthetase class 2